MQLLTFKDLKPSKAVTIIQSPYSTPVAFSKRSNCPLNPHLPTMERITDAFQEKKQDDHIN